MNPLPPNADELVSAYLDGEAAPDEIVTVESSPELMARVDSMRAVSGLVGQPVASPTQKEAHIAAALGAFDEIFSQGAAAEVATTDQAPQLRSVPSSSEPAAATAASTAATTSVATDPVETAPSDNTVTSFDAAKARRKPRRFNVGVIAAAIAAVLLVAALSVLTIGRPSGDDSASSTTAGLAVDAASDAASDAVDTSADSAMAEEEAMADEEETFEAGGLSDADSANALPAPTPSDLASRTDPQAALEVEEAMEDDAMDDSAMDDSASSAASPEAMDDGEVFGADLDEALPFFFGNFANSEELEAEFSILTAAELDQRKAGVGQGIFARCQAQIPALAAVDTATLIGEAGVDDMPRELHLLTDANGSMTVFVVNPQDCSIVDTFG